MPEPARQPIGVPTLVPCPYCGDPEGLHASRLVCMARLRRIVDEQAAQLAQLKPPGGQGVAGEGGDGAEGGELSDADIDALAAACPSGVAILAECLVVARMLLEKNAQYGDSALHPLRLLSNADVLTGLGVRADDKLSRLLRGNGEGDEDAEQDLLGYLVLRRVARRQRSEASA